MRRQSHGLFKLIFVLLAFAFQSSCQIFRDITLLYLNLDKDQDYLLSPEQQLQFTEETENRKFHNLQSFRTQLYPSVFWKSFDVDQDQRISVDELETIIVQKWAKYHSKIQQNQDNELDLLKAQEYMQICDANNDDVLSSIEFPACLHGVLVFETSKFPYPIQSSFYRNKNEGYDFGQFRKTLPMFKGQVTSYLLNMFDRFQWDNDKILSDNDEMIGPAEGRFLQPIVVMIILDRNRDGILNFEQAKVFLKRFGGDEVLEMVDENQNGEISRQEFVSYYVFACCIQCPQRHQSKDAKAKNGQNKDKIEQQL